MPFSTDDTGYTNKITDLSTLYLLPALQNSRLSDAGRADGVNYKLLKEIKAGFSKDFDEKLLIFQISKRIFLCKGWQNEFFRPVQAVKFLATIDIAGKCSQIQ